MSDITNPVITSFNTLAPIIIQKYENYLPTAFDDSLSLLQKVNKIIQSISTTNDTINSVIAQWNDQIVPYVNGDGFQTDVNNKLDQMVSDGTLNTLINQTILGSKATIIISSNAPVNPDEQTLWFKVV